jgi:hypothetical protein
VRLGRKIVIEVGSYPISTTGRYVISIPAAVVVGSWLEQWMER